MSRLFPRLFSASIAGALSSASIFCNNYNLHFGVWFDDSSKNQFASKFPGAPTFITINENLSFKQHKELEKYLGKEVTIKIVGTNNMTYHPKIFVEIFADGEKYQHNSSSTFSLPISVDDDSLPAPKLSSDDIGQNFKGYFCSSLYQNVDDNTCIPCKRDKVETDELAHKLKDHPGFDYLVAFYSCLAKKSEVYEKGYEDTDETGSGSYTLEDLEDLKGFENLEQFDTPEDVKSSNEKMKSDTPHESDIHAQPELQKLRSPEFQEELKKNFNTEEIRFLNRFIDELVPSLDGSKLSDSKPLEDEILLDNLETRVILPIDDPTTQCAEIFNRFLYINAIIEPQHERAKPAKEIKYSEKPEYDPQAIQKKIDEEVEAMLEERIIGDIYKELDGDQEIHSK